MNWLTVSWGIALQFIFALIVLRWQGGRNAFEWLGIRVEEFMAYTNYGTATVFGANYREHLVAFAASGLFVSIIICVTEVESSKSQV